MDRTCNGVVVHGPYYSLRLVRGNFTMTLSLKPWWDLVGSIIVPCLVITSQLLLWEAYHTTFGMNATHAYVSI